MRFFFYGTLIAGSGNPVARAIHAGLRTLGRGEAAGALYALPDPLGWYPALLAGDATVRGVVYEARGAFAAADLAMLDAYEDCDTRNPAASLYRRAPLEVRTGAGTIVSAQAYFYNQPLPEAAQPIAGGDFRAWLRAGSRQAYRGI
jgi:gamma-glutamylcyclotransferase (GGCT)/AIG2-like uncharacterized protein YtfP